MLEGVAVIVEPGRETLPSPFGGAKGDFLMRWSGDSMRAPDGSGIADGMVIHVSPTDTPIQGKPVFVRLADGEIICRRYQEGPAGRHLELINPAWPDRIMPFPDGAVVCGIVRGAWLAF